MNIIDLHIGGQIQGYYKTYLPLQHISIDRSNVLVIRIPNTIGTISCRFNSRHNGISEINFYINDILAESARTYEQATNIILNISHQSTLKIELNVCSKDEIFIHDLYLDEGYDAYYSSLNTHSVSAKLPIITKENAFIIIADCNFLPFLDLFIKSLRCNNDLIKTSIVGLIEENDKISYDFMIKNEIVPIKYRKNINMKTNKQLIYMDAARLCSSEYFCLIDIDMMIMDNIMAPFEILATLTDDTILLCRENGVQENIALKDLFNQECLIYPHNDSYAYIEDHVTHGAQCNNGVVYTGRKTLLQISNYYRTYSSRFRKWIEYNEQKCGWCEQAIFNIACSLYNMVYLNPVFNLQLNTQTSNVEIIDNIYIYNNKPIKVMHLNGIDRTRYNDYLAYGIEKYNWNPINNSNIEQLRKQFPKYFDSNIDYEFIKYLNNKKILLFNNKIDILLELLKNTCDFDIATDDFLIEAICINLNIKTIRTNDMLSFFQINDISNYDAIVINDIFTVYNMRALSEIMSERDISQPIYWKIDHGVKISKALPYLVETNITLEHIIGAGNSMYDQYFIMAQYNGKV